MNELLTAIENYYEKKYNNTQADILKEITEGIPPRNHKLFLSLVIDNFPNRGGLPLKTELKEASEKIIEDERREVELLRKRHTKLQQDLYALKNHLIEDQIKEVKEAIVLKEKAQESNRPYVENDPNVINKERSQARKEGREPKKMISKGAYDLDGRFITALKNNLKDLEAKRDNPSNNNHSNKERERLRGELKEVIQKLKIFGITPDDKGKELLPSVQVKVPSDYFNPIRDVHTQKVLDTIGR